MWIDKSAAVFVSGPRLAGWIVSNVKKKPGIR